MKAFLVAVSSLCLCAILLCFLAYATGNFPIPKTTKDTPISTSSQPANTAEIDPLCSPCVERMAMLLEMVQDWKAETTQLVSVPDSQSRSEDPDKSGQVEIASEEECSPCEENLKQLKEARERWEREQNTQEALLRPIQMMHGDR